MLSAERRYCIFV